MTFPSFVLLVFRNTTDACALTFNPATWLNPRCRSSSRLVSSLGFFPWTVTSCSQRDRSPSSSSIRMHFISCACLTRLIGAAVGRAADLTFSWCRGNLPSPSHWEPESVCGRPVSVRGVPFFLICWPFLSWMSVRCFFCRNSCVYFSRASLVIFLGSIPKNES